MFKSLQLSILLFTVLVIVETQENGNKVILEYDDASDFSTAVEPNERPQKSDEIAQPEIVVIDGVSSAAQSIPDLSTESVLITSELNEKVEISSDSTTVVINSESPETGSNTVPDSSSSTEAVTEETTPESTLIPDDKSSTESKVSDSTVNAIESDTETPKNTGVGTENLCPTGENLNEKISQIIKENIPSKVVLKDAKMGHRIPVILENGFMKLGTGKLSGAPSCQEGTDERVYTFFMDFNDIRGAYDWKLYNLFGTNLTETALLTLDHLKVDFSFVEKKSIVGERVSLQKLSLSPLQDLNVKVNIPEKIMEIKVINRVIAFITSRVTTFVMNRSKAAIAKNFEQSFVKAVKEKSAIHP